MIEQPLLTGEAEQKPPNAMNLLALALQNNAAIDVIERLAALQDKAMARDAEVDFNVAVAKVQSEIKRIAPDLDNPQTHSKYASYPAIDRVIRPIYSREGLSLSFDTTDCPIAEHVRVVCYVSLRSHTRRYQVDMPCDGKGAKGNDVMSKTHATGAATQYGMRYLVKMIFNIAIGTEDTDGNGATNGETEKHLEGIEKAEDLDELKRLFNAAKESAVKAGSVGALDAYTKAAAARKAALQ